MSDAFLPLVLEERLLLFDARYVREILGSVTMTPVPHATLQLPGVFAHGHRALPLLDLCALFELTPTRTGSRLRTVILRLEQETVGTPADDVLEIVRVDQADLRAPHLWPGPYNKAEARLGERTATVVDLHRLLADCLPDAG